MTQMRDTTRSQATRLFMVVFIALGAWIVAIKTGERIPYLMTSEARQFRLAILFPVLAVLLGWFAFGHHWRETGQTGYQMRMAQLRTRGERVKNTIVLLVGSLLLPIGVAWTSIHLVAWIAYFVSSTPHEETYGIMDIKSVTAGYSFDMYNRSTGKEVALRVPLAWASGLRVGMAICAQGRSSPFGTVIEALKAADCSSLKKK